MIVHIPTKSLLLRVRPHTLAALRGIFPNHSREIDYKGHNLALPHRLNVVKVLRNMSIPAPSPIRYYYDWPRPSRFATVFDHQVETADFLTLHPRCFVLNEMGTSKTASTLWAIDFLMRLGLVKRVVIVSPLSTLEPVWRNEIFDVCMHRSAVILHASAEKRREMLAREVDFYIINHAGLKILSKDIQARADIDLIVVDEASVYRNATTDQYKVLEKTAKGKKLWMLTGAPCPNAPTDAWALARLISPSRVPQYFAQFKRETMSQITQYKWVPRPGSHEIAFNALQPAIRFKKSDCLTLPPVTYSNRLTDLTKEQTHAYQQMKNHFVAEAKAGIQITAANAADKISKLRQILAGAVKDTATGAYHDLPHGPRLKVLLEAIEQSACKVLVIVPFKGITYTLAKELDAWHGTQGDGRHCRVVNGDVTLKDRNAIFQDFRDDPNLTELVCHPAVMSHGLTLTQADMVIFYAPIYSNDQSGQVMDRINRPGQTRKMTILRIMANRLEAEIYAMVEGRRQTQESMLALYKRELGI